MFGIVIDGFLELSLMVVWNCRWWLLGTTLVVAWNCRCWL